ncbi:MAG: hypothetical protein ABJE10_14635 [bacterium]
MTRLLLPLAFILAAATPARAQDPVSTTGPTTPSITGQIFGSYNYQLPVAGAAFANQIDNSFVIDRASLTFRMPAGDHVSIRVTTDVYPTTEGTPNAYTVRVKYAYLQFDAPNSAAGGDLSARIGLVQNVVIEHLDSFFPRYLSQSSVERALFFSVADAGLAARYVMPHNVGEIYATIVNGPGYTSREKDRFKDFAMRVSLTPLANHELSPLWKSLTLTAWGYKGAVASSFVNGGTGQVAPIGEALDRSREGVFAAVREPRLTLGAEFSQRHDDGDIGDNTVATPRTVSRVTAQLLSGFIIARPMRYLSSDDTSPFGLVARYDYVKPTAKTSGFPLAPPSSNAYHTMIAGVFTDLSPRSQLALDYQEQLTSNGTSSPPNPSKGYYLHFNVTF